MSERYCPNCGTGVDDDARFCPVCGQPIDPPEAPIPAATTSSDEAAAAAVEPEAAAEPEPPAEVPAAPPTAPAPPPAEPTAAPPPADRGGDLPFSVPTMLSGWLIGGGSLLAAIGLAPSLGRALSVMLFVALLWLAASVFLPDRLPALPRERLVVLGVAFIGLGMALDRTGFDPRGWETTFLIGMLAVAGGALLVELDRDRPIPPPDRPPS
ncbi:MAG TPA: zinc ribbon domain-containing protein [Candidatus Limnocylindria bacterium]